eukprot:15460551-Alexandrium_andersonii.AAC.1
MHNPVGSVPGVARICTSPATRRGSRSPSVRGAAQQAQEHPRRPCKADACTGAALSRTPAWPWAQEPSR